MIQWKVTKGEKDSSLGSFIYKKVDQKLSQRKIKFAIESHLCEVNQKIVHRHSQRLISGDFVTFFEELVPFLPPAKHRFDRERILFEDDHLLAYDKPPAIPTDEKGLFKVLQELYPKLKMVHRLDRDTSGVILFAKSHLGERSLLEQFRKRVVKKRYLALVYGTPNRKEGVIDNFIGIKRKLDHQKIWGEVPKRLGARALTEWRVAQKGKKSSLIECSPKTGRTHQIRVHLSEMGYPIVGDFNYSKGAKWRELRFPRVLLHAEEIRFSHVVTGEEMVIECAVPSDMRAAIEMF